MSDEHESLPPEHVSPTEPPIPNLLPAPTVSPTDVTELHLPVPLRSPPLQWSQQRHTFPIGRRFTLAILAFVLIGGGLGFIVFALTTQYQTSLHSQATAFVRQTRQTQSTALAQTTGTANAFATANANIYATATAQAGVTATLTAQTNTATTLDTIFTHATSGTPAWNDPLSDNTGHNNWDEITLTIDGSCGFTNGTYHAIQTRQGYLQRCIAESTSFGNFAYQIQMTIDKGNQGGILFRATSAKGSFYFFRIGIDGSYAFDRYTGASQATTLSQGFSSAIITGLAHSNQIAVIASKAQLYLYINQQYITSVTDNTLRSGSIGVAALDIRNPTGVEFSNAQVWSST